MDYLKESLYAFVFLVPTGHLAALLYIFSKIQYNVKNVNK